MSTKGKLFTILGMFILLILLSGFGAFKAGKVSGGTVQDVSDIRSLGGIKNRMPENSSFVFWKSLTGAKLSSYKAYDSIDETLCALRSGEISAMWATDVTADYLCRTNDDLKIITTEGMSALQNTQRSRFDFAMALRKEDEDLKNSIDECLGKLAENGDLINLQNTDIYYANGKLPFSEKDMDCKGDRKLVIGITGTVPPIDMVDSDGYAVGFAPKLMEQIGNMLGMDVEFEVLDNETIFTSLMSGRIDAVFAYGTGMNTTENKKNYIMTKSYCTMWNYKYITLK